MDQLSLKGKIVMVLVATAAVMTPATVFGWSDRAIWGATVLAIIIAVPVVEEFLPRLRKRSRDRRPASHSG